MTLKPALVAFCLTTSLTSHTILADVAADYKQAAKEAHTLKNETTALLFARKAVKAAKDAGAAPQTQALYMQELAALSFEYKTRDALDLLEHSLAATQSAFGSDHASILPLMLDTADMNLLRREKDRAHTLYTRIIEESRRQFGAGGAYHEGLAELRIADMFYNHNQPTRAAKHAATALDILEHTEPEPATLMVADALHLLGYIALDEKAFEAAKVYFEGSLAYYDVYGKDITVKNGQDNIAARSLMKRLLLIAHKEGNINKAEVYARRYGLSRYWRAGHLIYDPTLNTHSWEGSQKEGTIKHRIGYRASYTILPSGRATDINVLHANGITSDTVKLMLETAYFIPKLEDGLLVSYKTTTGPYGTIAYIPAKYATLDIGPAAP